MNYVVVLKSKYIIDWRCSIYMDNEKSLLDQALLDLLLVMKKNNELMKENNNLKKELEEKRNAKSTSK